MTLCGPPKHEILSISVLPLAVDGTRSSYCMTEYYGLGCIILAPRQTQPRYHQRRALPKHERGGDGLFEHKLIPLGKLLDEMAACNNRGPSVLISDRQQCFFINVSARRRPRVVMHVVLSYSSRHKCQMFAMPSPSNGFLLGLPLYDHSSTSLILPNQHEFR